jgi:hypothetical protein
MGLFLLGAFMQQFKHWKSSIKNERLTPKTQILHTSYAWYYLLLAGLWRIP